MMTTLSIDTSAGTIQPAGSVSPAQAVQGDVQALAALADATARFQQTLSEQADVNVAVCKALRAALASIGTTPGEVAKSSAGSLGGSGVSPLLGEEEVASVTSGGTLLPQALPDQLSQNAALAATLANDTAAVAATLGALGGSGVRGSGVSPLLGEEAVASVTSGVTPLPQALPDQLSQNAALAATLANDTAVVADALGALRGSGVRGSGVSLLLGEEAVSSVTSGGTHPASSLLRSSLRSGDMLPQELPDQLSQNAALAATLANDTAAVADALGALGGSGVSPLLGEETVSSVTSGGTPLPQEPLLGEEAISSVTSGGTTLPQTLSGHFSQNDAPEATADALVAAGVTVTPSTTPVQQVEAPVAAVSTAPVDFVRTQAAASASADMVVQAASAVADALLVSPGLLRGQGEILVQLKPDVLDGSTVQISVTGRQLEVVFQPQTVDTAVLIENCRPQIAEYLSGRIRTFNVSVDVRKKRENA